MDAIITESRKAFYKALVNVLLIDTAGVPSNADKDNPLSVRIASGIAKLIEAESRGTRLAAQASGSKFEEICLTFLTNTFLR